MTSVCLKISATQTFLLCIVTYVLIINLTPNPKAAQDSGLKDLRSILFLRRFPDQNIRNTQQKAITLNRPGHSLPKHLEFNRERDDSIRFSSPDKTKSRETVEPDNWRLSRITYINRQITITKHFRAESKSIDLHLKISPIFLYILSLQFWFCALFSDDRAIRLFMYEKFIVPLNRSREENVK